MKKIIILLILSVLLGSCSPHTISENLPKSQTENNSSSDSTSSTPDSPESDICNNPPCYRWVKTIGGSGKDEGLKGAIDPQGNVYILGFFSNTVNFKSPWNETETRTSEGYEDIFILKINNDGSFGWVRQFGGANSENSGTIAVDSNGYIYAAIRCESELHLDGDTSTTLASCESSGDIVIIKLSQDGNIIWLALITGNSNSDYPNGMAIDSLNNIYITGLFNGTLDFGSPFGQTDSKTSEGSGDVFVLKITPDKTYGWTAVAGGSSDDESYDITIDANNNIYITGYFCGSATFGSDTKDSGDIYTPDAFISKLDSNGNFIWTKQIGSSSDYDSGNTIISDLNGNIYIGGYFSSTVTFDSDFGGTSDSKTSNGYEDGFITKIDENANYLWTLQIGGNYGDEVETINIGPAGNIYAGGYFLSDSVDFRADFQDGNSDIITNAGSSYEDAYAIKFSPTKTYGYTKHFGGVGAENLYNIVVDKKNGYIYLIGSFQDTVDFRGTFDNTTENKTSNGDKDVFILKFKAVQ